MNDILLTMSSIMEIPNLTPDKINIILNSLLTINKTNVLPLVQQQNFEEEKNNDMILSASERAKKNWKM